MFNLTESDFTEDIRQRLGASYDEISGLRRDHVGKEVPAILGTDADAKKVGFSSMREHDVCHYLHAYCGE